MPCHDLKSNSFIKLPPPCLLIPGTTQNNMKLGQQKHRCLQNIYCIMLSSTKYILYDAFVACTKVGFAWLQSAAMARSVWCMIHPISYLYVSINFSSNKLFCSCAIPIFLRFYDVPPLFLIEISPLCQGGPLSYKLGLQKLLTISQQYIIYIYVFLNYMYVSVYIYT